MARIRTVKPEFFRHEGLQDLEIANPGGYPMMVFAGLWGHCDKAGRFEWRPRILKLDILPFLPFDMAQTLELLKEAGLLRYYIANGKEYGEVVTFGKHQRISGKEAQEGVKHPGPSEAPSGSTGEAMGKHPGAQEGSTGKGREQEEEGKEPSSSELRPDAAVQSPGGEKWGTAEDLRAAEYVHGKVLAVSPGAKAPNWAAWSNDIRLMRERDGRTHREVCELFAWANADSFWRANILSPGALREKWTQLDAKRRTNGHGPPNKHAGFEARDYAAGQTKVEDLAWVK